MDNIYEPPGGNPAEESRPTEPFWPVSPGPDPSPGPRYQPPATRSPDTRTRAIRSRGGGTR